MSDVPRETSEPEYRVPLCYTREEFDSFLANLRRGTYGDLWFAKYETGGDSYVIARGRRYSLRFNRLRLVDDVQHARDLAAILTAWADLQEEEAP